jgi:hypothetical protein
MTEYQMAIGQLLDQQVHLKKLIQETELEFLTG